MGKDSRAGGDEEGDLDGQFLAVWRAAVVEGVQPAVEQALREMVANPGRFGSRSADAPTATGRVPLA